MRLEHLSIQLVSCVSPFYLVDEFISLLQVLAKGMRMVGDSKILSLLISGVD